MKVNMNIIALEITSTTVLLAAVIQSAHPIDARGSSQGGLGQGRVADNLQSNVDVNPLNTELNPICQQYK